MNKKCLVCKKVKSKRNKNFCSKICEFESKKRNCLICKKLYQPIRSTSKYCSIVCRGIACTGERSVSWKGDEIGFGSLHKWIRNNKSKPEWCGNCMVARPYDLANISQEYKRDINDFEWLCRRCHMEKDGRLENLIKARH